MKKRLLRFGAAHNSVLILLLMLVTALIACSPLFVGGNVNLFLRPNNLVNLSQSIGLYSILAMGLTFVFLVGGIDLSIGWQVAFDGAVFATLVPAAGLWPAAAITLLTGLAVGYCNGVIVTRLEITPLIGTLAMMSILKGLVYILNSENIGMSSERIAGMSFKSFYDLRLLGVLTPPLLAAVVIAVLLGLFLKMTRTGVNLYVTGGNREAGVLAGVNAPRLTRLAYAMGGLCSAVCAVLSVFRLNAATYNMGDNIDILAICAVVVGGVKMQGGRGNMAMCFLGVSVMQIITNIMNKLNLHTSAQAAVTGIVVILVLLLDRFTGAEQEDISY